MLLNILRVTNNTMCAIGNLYYIANVRKKAVANYARVFCL